MRGEDKLSGADYGQKRDINRGVQSLSAIFPAEIIPPHSTFLHPCYFSTNYIGIQALPSFESPNANTA